MDEKLYYRFEPIGIDVLNEKEVANYNERLISFSVLDSRFALLETVYNNQIKERADIFINALPAVNGVTEMSVYHDIRFKLFSRRVKSQCFSLCVTFYNEIGESWLYFYASQDIAEVKGIFENFVTYGIIPDFTKWQQIKTS